MKTPSAYHMVLNIAMAFSTALYAAMGFFGYWRYENATQPAITLNLPKTHL